MVRIKASLIAAAFAGALATGGLLPAHAAEKVAVGTGGSTSEPRSKSRMSAASSGTRASTSI